ncbi:MAG: hypothetical protein JNM28_00160 [Armatimonadetes bacterium]|nr:hypothetical protein [Armatimonadota bacterium]MBS1711411.1 hypothetical protein [Armatimonadota bacterium]MBX3107664.1 hypothetical protein [Fimbriimonadaceae bacterium]
MASLSNPGLYAKIMDFQIDDPGVALPFSRRLARENGWSPEFADRVVGEYRRFVYLCLAAGHPCTPSDEVDQAWHLHMLYTSSYFGRFCPEVLGKTLSHEPTKGGSHENRKFDDWYSRTVESYRLEFGEAPPPDIWPPNNIRFSRPMQFKRVNVADYYLIPRRAVAQGAWGLAGLAGSAAAIGCTTQVAGAGMLGPAGSIVLWVGGTVILGAIVLALARLSRGRGGSGGSSGCSPGVDTFSHGDSHGHHGGHDSNGCGSHGCGSSGCSSSGCSSGCGGGCGGGGD